MIFYFQEHLTWLRSKLLFKTDAIHSYFDSEVTSKQNS